jgi:hypothetical protein
VYPIAGTVTIFAGLPQADNIYLVPTIYRCFSKAAYQRVKRIPVIGDHSNTFG